MDAILIRIGADQAYGGCNAPVCSRTREFVYLPIPEGSKAIPIDGLAKTFDEFVPAYKHFKSKVGMPISGCELPARLLGKLVHLDPDFEHLTYGDDGGRRGARVKSLKPGDLLVFYAGLKPLDASDKRLEYALIGMLTVEEIMSINDIPEERWHENAHTRKQSRGEDDIVVFGKAGQSGRLEKCIPIGEFRAKAYRVRRDLLDAWGDLDVKDGFIQRSVRPPMFKDATRFKTWLDEQDVSLLALNNPT